MKNKTTIALVAAIVVQMVLIATMVYSATWPYLNGIQIEVRTLVVDPRSMFRGNYVKLRYAFNQIPYSEIPDGETLENGDPVYTILKQDSTGTYVHSGVQLNKPDSGIYLCGTCRSSAWGEHAKTHAIEYGIEAYFLPKSQAIEMGNAGRGNLVCTLIVSESGAARIKTVRKTKE